MINAFDIWTELIKSLKAGLPSYTFIKANQSANLPDYPFVTLNILNPNVRDRDMIRGTLSRENITGDDTKIKINKTETPKMVFSINCYSDKQSEVSSVLKDAINWLTFSGQQDLSDRGIIVLNNGDVQDRTNFLEVDYQYVYGFDLTIRVNDEVSMNVDTIGSVEAEDKDTNEKIDVEV